MKSLISEIIKTNKNWRTFFRENYPCIKIKESLNDPHDPNIIFNYGIGADFTDPIVKEARGIILDKNTGEVICWPFNKFGKYNETYADDIDWSTARVETKVDGSIIKLYFNKYKNKWCFASNGMIYAEDAPTKHQGISLMDLIKNTDCYENIIYCLNNNKVFDKNNTYILELVSPENQVVINYNNLRSLFHLGTRNNITGEEIYDPICTVDDRLVLRRIPTYEIHSLDQCIKAAIILNDNHGKISSCENEGFVVVDANWNRIKVKSPIYMMLHNIVTNSDTSITLLLEMLYNKQLDVDSICEQFPNLAHFIKYYDFKITEYLYTANAFLDITRQLYNKLGDRKEVSLRIKDDKLSYIGFMGMDNNLTLEEILLKKRGGIIKDLKKNIQLYEPVKLGYLFDGLENN